MVRNLLEVGCSQGPRTLVFSSPEGGQLGALDWDAGERKSGPPSGFGPIRAGSPPPKGRQRESSSAQTAALPARRLWYKFQ